jgi:hypothetical protein
MFLFILILFYKTPFIFVTYFPRVLLVLVQAISAEVCQNQGTACPAMVIMHAKTFNLPLYLEGDVN